MEEKCIEAMGLRMFCGYPMKRSKYAKNERKASRVVWEEKYGEIPKGMVIMHLCDNPKCVNIKHLRMGTQKENVLDMYSKNRQADFSGEGNGRAKLNKKQVLDIKKKYKTGFTQKMLSIEYGVCESNISHIINNKRWAES